MKFLHWIIYTIGLWVFLGPLIMDDVFDLFLGTDAMSELDIINLMRWDDLFLGIATIILSLLIITNEQATTKTPGITAMHWLHTLAGLWLATAPFTLNFTYTSYSISHVITGAIISLIALLQIRYEQHRHSFFHRH